MRFRSSLATAVSCAMLLAAPPAPAGPPAPAARAAVALEGTYTVTAPEKATVRFRLLLTGTGARLVPATGETIVFSYEQRSAMVIDHQARSYFILPLELLPPLLAEGIGYDPARAGVQATGKTQKILGMECAEVLATGSTRWSLRTWRVKDPAWGVEYARLEQAMALPWIGPGTPSLFLGIPLRGTLEVNGKRPYRASWEVSRISREEGVEEGFVAPAGYRIDLERLVAAQGGKRR